MPYPHDATTQDMIPFMATKGADLLVKGLKHRVFESTESITHSEASMLEITDGKGIAHAPKITPEDRHISSWKDMDAATLLRKNRALGNLWDTTTFKRWMEEQHKEFPKLKSQPIPPKRVIFGALSKYDISSSQEDSRVSKEDRAVWVDGEIARVVSILEKNPHPGQLIFLHDEKYLPNIEMVILTSDYDLLQIHSCTVEGGAKNNGIAELWAVRRAHRESFQQLSMLEKRRSIEKEQTTQWKKEREENPKISLKYQKLRLKLKENMDPQSDGYEFLHMPKGQKLLATLREEANEMGDPERYNKDCKDLKKMERDYI